jgi:hypothetical protein
MGSLAFEKHYRLKDLAALWGLSRKTVTRIFAGQAGVVRVANDVTSKRKYVTLSIPESVASCVHERLGNHHFQEGGTTATQSPRIIRLCDIHPVLAGNERNVVKLKTLAKVNAREQPGLLIMVNRRPGLQTRSQVQISDSATSLSSRRFRLLIHFA